MEAATERNVFLKIYIAFFVYFEKIISFVITLVTEICAVKQIASPVMQHASLNHKNQLKRYGKQGYLLEVSIAVAGDKLWFLPLKYFIFVFPNRRNIQSNNKTYLTICNYDPETDPLCPIFQLGKIVELAGVNFDDIAYKVSSGLN